MGFKKGEKVNDEATLERLRSMREKATEVRKQKAEERKTLKLNDELNRKEELAKAEKRVKEPWPELLKRLPNEREKKNKLGKTTERTRKKEPQKIVLVQEEYDSEVSEHSSVSSSDSESEPEVKVIHTRAKSNREKQNKQPTVDNHKFDKTYRSLFPDF